MDNTIIALAVFNAICVLFILWATLIKAPYSYIITYHKADLRYHIYFRYFKSSVPKLYKPSITPGFRILNDATHYIKHGLIDPGYKKPVPSIEYRHMLPMTMIRDRTAFMQESIKRDKGEV